MSFTENRFPIHISEGASGGPSFNTNVQIVYSGFEERKQKWEEERNRYEALHENIDEEDFYDILKFFKSMRGRLYGFRYKDWGDYKSCDVNDDISATDQTLGNGDGVTAAYQLIKTYNEGFAYQRDITKPVASTTLLSIGGVESTTNFSVNTTTGVVTIDDNQSTVAGAETNGTKTRITTVSSNPLVTGDSVFLSGFTGDWAALNGNRYEITVLSSAIFEFTFDSSGFALYSSNGGSVDTLPQSGEVVTAGFEFDVPCRFDSDEMISSWVTWKLYGFSLPIIEIKI